MKHALKLLLWRPDPEARARAWYDGTLEAYREAEDARDRLLTAIAKVVLGVCAFLIFGLVAAMAKPHEPPPPEPKRPVTCTMVQEKCPTKLA